VRNRQFATFSHKTCWVAVFCNICGKNRHGKATIFLSVQEKKVNKIRNYEGLVLRENQPQWLRKEFFIKINRIWTDLLQKTEPQQV
jgi:hypothetical protein